MQMKADRAVVFNTLRKKLASIDPDLAAFRFETYAGRRQRNSGGLGFISNLFLLLGVATVLLAASGIYGVTSNTINQRTQEIGVKRALGAVEQRITKEFLIVGLKQLLWGGIPGCLIGGAVGYVLSAQMGIGGIGLLIISLFLVATIACVVLFSTWLPTQRVLKITPSEALRYE
jgi:ABC-type antimicrobial peptide transport system permease subunit